MGSDRDARAASAPRRVRTPTILQLEAVECGAATLAMVLAYYGRYVPLATLRRECGVSRDGSKASNVVKAARRYGLDARGFSKEIADLAELEPPAILYWNFNHFVVFEGFGKDVAYVNDPAAGHRTVSMEEFERAFTGVVLVCRPGPDFRPGGKRPSLVGAIRGRLSGSAGALAYCALAGLLLVIPGLTIPALSQVFIDEVILAGRADWLRPLILTLLVAMAMHVALRFLQLRYLRRLRTRLAIRMAGDYMWHLLQLPASFYAQRYAGEVANRSQINNRLAQVLSGQLAQTAIDVAMIGFYALVMFLYDAVLTAIGVVFALVNFAVLRWVSARRVEANMRVLMEYGKAQGAAIAGLQGMETLKAGGLENGFFGTWSGYYTRGTNARQDLEVSNQVLSTLPTLLNALTSASILVIGGFRIINGELSIGMLVAFQALMSSFLAPVTSLLELGSTLQVLRGDLDRVDDVLQHPVPRRDLPTVTHDEDGERLVRLKGYVELRAVTFGYSPIEAPLIENFSLAVEPGQRVALVGASGSGKTTIARLISGEYEHSAGEVLLDGMARGAVPEQVLVNSFATVDQEVALFAASVRDNLTLWDDTVPEHHLARACEDAAIDETIRALRGGYDAMLLEGGANLSGGQRQRLEIARALVHNPAILVFDEATSALDAQTEAMVMERLRMRGCTVILVAHRLSTVRDCDEIVVLQAGQVIERGTHEALWAANGEYARLMQVDQDPAAHGAGSFS